MLEWRCMIGMDGWIPGLVFGVVVVIGCIVYCMRERQVGSSCEHNFIAVIYPNIIIHGDQAQAKSLRMSNLSYQRATSHGVSNAIPCKGSKFPDRDRSSRVRTRRADNFPVHGGFDSVRRAYHQLNHAHWKDMLQ